MEEKKPAISDDKLDIFISNILRAGVALSAAFVLSGGIFYLVQNAFAPALYHTFTARPSELLNLHGMVANIRAFNNLGIIQLGLLILIATPVIRIVTSLTVFVIQRDRLYTAVTFIVLCILMYSIFRG
jgi:uncharacterized membrane protein